MDNWRRYLSSNWYEMDQKRGSKFGALLWRHLTPQRINHNIGAQLGPTVHPVYNCSKKILENLLPVGLLVCTNLFIPSRFWTTCRNFTLLSTL